MDATADQLGGFINTSMDIGQIFGESVTRRETIVAHGLIVSAIEAYEKVLTWLTVIDDAHMPESMYVPNWAPGGVAILASETGIDDPNLILAFIRERTNAAFALTPDKQPALIIPVLKSHNNLSGIIERFGDHYIRRNFVHEYIHFLRWRKTGHIAISATSSWQPNRVPDAPYYNDPEEIASFTGEAIATAKNHQAIFENMPDAEAVNYIVQHYISWGFWQHLTPNNRRRVRNRLLWYVTNFIRKS